MGLMTSTIELLISLRIFFFGFEGRIGRTAFVAGQIGIVASLFMFGLIIPMLTVTAPEKGLFGVAKIGYIFYLSFLCLLYFWSFLALSAKRCHDFGKSFAENFFGIMIFNVPDLMFKEGDLGQNNYGHRRAL